MSELLHVGPLSLALSTDGNGAGRPAGANGARSAGLLWQASAIALVGAILAQPAMAQSAPTPSTQRGAARAQDPGAPASAGRSTDNASDTTITVTGTLITSNENSPTPITAVETAEMAVTTPSDIADGLNKLPQIMGGRTPRTQGNGSTNNGGNVLSLRNFGP